MKTTTLRLRRIRFKNGNTVEVLRPKGEDVAGIMRRSVNLAIEGQTSPIVGFAYVAWQQNGEVMANFHNGDRSPILAGGTPQYVKDVLLAEVACRWMRDS